MFGLGKRTGRHMPKSRRSESWAEAIESETGTPIRHLQPGIVLREVHAECDGRSHGCIAQSLRVLDTTGPIGLPGAVC